MKAHEGVEVYRRSFLTSVLDGGWLINFIIRLLYPRYKFNSRLGGPQSNSGRFGGDKCLARDGNRNTTARLSSTYPSHYTDRAIPAPLVQLHVKQNINHKLLQNRLLLRVILGPSQHLVLYSVEWKDLQIMKLKGLGRKWSLSSSRITPAFDWYWGKARKIQDKPRPGRHSIQASPE
jgi:hypothetical protein